MVAAGVAAANEGMTASPAVPRTATLKNSFLVIPKFKAALFYIAPPITVNNNFKLFA